MNILQDCQDTSRRDKMPPPQVTGRHHQYSQHRVKDWTFFWGRSVQKQHFIESRLPWPAGIIDPIHTVHLTSIGHP
jgi:hypothetical protein